MKKLKASLFRITLITLLGISIAEAGLPPNFKPHGIFVSGGKFVPEDIMEKPYVEGALVRPRWRDLEPEPGKFDWSFLDAEIGKVKKAGKKYTLAILGGPGTPDWVFQQKGVKGFVYSFFNPYSVVDRRIPQKMPVPWDATYLELWQNLIRKVAQRYGNDPALYLVHVTHSTQNGLEMMLPFDKSRGRDKNVNIPDWHQYGYSKAILMGSWKTVIDTFVEAFPDKPLDLEIHPVLEDHSIPSELIDYGISKAPGRFGAFGAWLNNRQQPWDRPLRDIMSKAGKRAYCNYQLIGNETRQAERVGMGGLKGTIELGMSQGCYYYEIWEVDLKNPKFSPWLNQLHAELKSKAQHP